MLLSDPYRAAVLPLLGKRETDGWRATHSRWLVGGGAQARQVAVFELTPPPFTGV